MQTKFHWCHDSCKLNPCNNLIIIKHLNLHLTRTCYIGNFKSLVTLLHVWTLNGLRLYKLLDILHKPNGVQLFVILCTGADLGERRRTPFWKSGKPSLVYGRNHYSDIIANSLWIPSTRHYLIFVFDVPVSIGFTPISFFNQGSFSVVHHALI